MKGRAQNRANFAATCGCAATALVVLIAAAGCGTAGMEDQPRYEPFEASDFFGDGLSARPKVPGTVARGQLPADDALATGRRGGQLVEVSPVKLDRALLVRGQERFNIYCAVCHGLTGEGDGMVPQRGFRRPPSYHIERLRRAPVGHFYDVITAGFGAMPSFAAQLEPRDRWAVVAYVGTLQVARSAKLEDVPADARRRLEEAKR